MRAAGGIAATFNAPITGLFFGFEIVLREFSLDAMFATILAAVSGDLVSRAFFGSAPFFTGMPHGLVVGKRLQLSVDRGARPRGGGHRSWVQDVLVLA